MNFQTLQSSAFLNMRPGCNFLEWYSNCVTQECGQHFNGSDCHARHHRSADYFLDMLQPSSMNTFRFVDYNICRYNSNSARHARIEGLADSVGGRDMIVSLATNIMTREAVTAHEISHLLGAHDGRCVPSDAECVMRGARTSNRWCSRCKADIIAYRPQIVR